MPRPDGPWIASSDGCRSLKSGHLGAVGLDVYEKESAYFFSDSSSKIIQDDNFARLLSFYNVFVRYLSPVRACVRASSASRG